MIPKIAYFHWSQRGPEMSWLRWVSLQTFKKYNPDWDIRLIPTDRSISTLGLQLGQEADYTWWKALAETGGFQVATDIIFCKPIPDEWLDCDLNACVNKEPFAGVYQFAALGCSQNNDWMAIVAETALQVIESHRAVDYQDLGVHLLRSLHVEMDMKAGRIFNQPMSALCHVDDAHFPELWDDTEIELPDEVIGVHWYGGGTISRKEEWLTGPETKNFLSRFARKCLERDVTKGL